MKFLLLFCVLSCATCARPRAVAAPERSSADAGSGRPLSPIVIPLF